MSEQDEPWYTGLVFEWSQEYPTGDGRENWSLLVAKDPSNRRFGRGYGLMCCDGVGNSPQGLGDYDVAELLANAPATAAERDSLKSELEAVRARVERAEAPKRVIKLPGIPDKEWTVIAENDERVVLAGPCIGGFQIVRRAALEPKGGE